MSDTSLQNILKGDLVSETICYHGEADPGAEDHEPVWRIKRIEFLLAGGVTEKFANGDSNFVHAWADRNSLTYS
ncbi:hypothetical protein GBK02_09990 [Dechloromonas sp. TW-R-39-2]|uniref:hypothetical protein n=1 Tax=Dechloromonas sp. TW-R-39-2 TaxID=2654218 RepID=UPI00193DA6E8|nr:hypothetical protein [Dechloromonas sp. TW-R-39-2]QRM19708.1 hypothetical protein GBK02_09990 [Dechloromonas sp. TW-R-39-2]